MQLAEKWGIERTHPSPRFEKGERRWGKGVEKSIPFLFSPPPLLFFYKIGSLLPSLPYPTPPYVLCRGEERGGGYIPSRVIDQSSCWGEERNLSRIPTTTYYLVWKRRRRQYLFCLEAVQHVSVEWVRQKEPAKNTVKWF